MRIRGPIALANVPAAPWKNGGGTTRTLAVAPAGASLDDFLWRVSIARIDQPVEFSSFPGIDRTIMIWRGAGMVLRSPAWPEQALKEPSQPFGFRGEDTVFCEPLGSPVEDLNLMVRRGAAAASVRCDSAELVLPAECGDAVVLCARGMVEIAATDGAVCLLASDHYLLLSDLDDPVAILPKAARTRVVSITAKRLQPSRVS